VSPQADCQHYKGLLYDMYFEVANLRLGRGGEKQPDWRHRCPRRQGCRCNPYI